MQQFNFVEENNMTRLEGKFQIQSKYVNVTNVEVLELARLHSFYMMEHRILLRFHCFLTNAHSFYMENDVFHLILSSCNKQLHANLIY